MKPPGTSDKTPGRRRGSPGAKAAWSRKERRPRPGSPPGVLPSTGGSHWRPDEGEARHPRLPRHNRLVPLDLASLRDDLRRETLALSPAERVERALRLGDDDALIYAAAEKIPLHEAREALRQRRQVGRRPSAVMTGIRS